jgi:heme/copper-type cytochrome/quinol oxidase subunit 3
MESAGAGIPLNPGVAGVNKDVAIPPEPPEIGARSLYIAGRLLAGASTFFFLAFLFAFFYLRSLDENHMWKPADVKPDQALGAVVVACVVVSALLAILAGRQMKRHSAAWVVAAGCSLALGLAAVAAQCIQYTVQHFGPTNGGYASVFCGWTGLYALAVITTMYWIETQVATELRARREPASAHHGDFAEADRLIAPSLDAAVFFWSYLAGIGVVTWICLYLV